MRKLVIFGNGLGKAINPVDYDLQRALAYAWNDPKILSSTQKELIRQCLPHQVVEVGQDIHPGSESELDKLQRVLAACDEILDVEKGSSAGWLNEDGRAFPIAIRGYIHSAASYFHALPHVLPREFSRPLIDWTIRSRSHIATLNYDELLYRSFVGTPVFDGYNCLIDGFLGPFDDARLERRRPSSQSYYLHLHGSPLYYTDQNGEIHKASLFSLRNFAGYSGSHIVLTHVAHKVSVIASSPVLSAYWRRLEEAIAETKSIVLFGYGGGDSHLNQLISAKFKGTSVEVVERKKPDYDSEAGKQTRFKYWTSRISTKLLICHWYSNILDFSNWDYDHSKYK